MSETLRLGPVDANFHYLEHYRDCNTSMVCVIEFEPGASWEPISERLHDATRDRSSILRKRIVSKPFGFGNPALEPVDDFDSTDHVVVHHERNGNFRSAIQELADSVQSARWDSSRPPWSLTFLVGSPGELGCVVKSHHALADGVEMARIWAPILFGPVSRSARPRSSERSRSVGASSSAEPAMLGAFRDSLRATTGGRTRRSYFAEVDAASFRATAAACGGGVNDLFVALAAACTAGYQEQSGGRCRGIENVVMPVDIRPAGPDEHDARNEFAIAVLPVDTRGRLADAVSRVSLESTAAIAKARAGTGAEPKDWLRFLPGGWRARLVHGAASHAKVVATNVCSLPSLDARSNRYRSAYALAPCYGADFVFGLMRTEDTLFIGINTDDSVVADPLVAVSAIAAAFAAAGLPVRVRTRGVPTPDPEQHETGHRTRVGAP